MKKIWYFIIGFSVIAIAIGLWLGKKVSAAKKIDFALGDTDVKFISFSEGFEITAQFILKNFSESKFVVNQLKADIYTYNDYLIAPQPAPLSAPLEIAPSSNTPVNLTYTLNVASVLQLVLNSGIEKDKGDNIFTIAQRFLETGVIGAKAKVIGFVEVDGLTIKLNETIDI